MRKMQLSDKWFRTAAVRTALAGLFVFGVLFGGGCAGQGADVYSLEEEGIELADAAGMARITEDEEPAPAEEEARADETEEACIVHICGAVAAPGVYELPKGSRVMDAVNAGGGFLPEADQDSCNLAARITDGCQIYIMTEEDSCLVSEQLHAARSGSGFMVSGESPLETAEDGKVNLNTADAEALKTLPGIGDSRAAAIIAWRQEHGPFSCIEDVMKVSGIKQAAFEKIKDKITV